MVLTLVRAGFPDAELLLSASCTLRELQTALKDQYGDVELLDLSPDLPGYIAMHEIGLHHLSTSKCCTVCGLRHSLWCAVHGAGGQLGIERPPKAQQNSKPVPPKPSFATRQAIQNADLITDWLYIGGSLAAGSKPALRAMGVLWVLNCCERIPFASGSCMRGCALNELCGCSQDAESLTPNL